MNIDQMSPTALGELHDFWAYWGFCPWNEPPFTGVSRSQNFIKSGLLGKVAEFHAWDCIVWDAGTDEERAKLWHSRKPMPDIMTQRFLFLLPKPWADRRIRSFALGFRGYVEFFAYYPGSDFHPQIKDLTGLVDHGMKLLHQPTMDRGNILTD